MRGWVRARGDRYVCGFDGPRRSNGDRNTIWVGTFETESEAYAALAQRVVEMEQGGGFVPRPDSLAVYLREWVQDITGIKGSTRNIYMRHVELHIIPELGRVRLRDLRPRDVKRLHQALFAKGLSPASIRGVHGVLSHALRAAVELEEIARNVAELVRPPTVERQEAKYWTVEQARHFMRSIEGDAWALPFQLMLATGMRAGECLALTWADVDLADAVVHIRRTMTITARGQRIQGEDAKSDAGQRRIRIDQTTLGYLKLHHDRERFVLGMTPASYLFRGEVEGQPLVHSTLVRRFGILLERCGLGGTLTIHGLRHTHATMLLSGGVDAKTVSQRLGHASVTFTLNSYGHVLDEMQENAAVTTDRLLRVVR